MEREKAREERDVDSGRIYFPLKAITALSGPEETWMSAATDLVDLIPLRYTHTQTQTYTNTHTHRHTHTQTHTREQSDVTGTPTEDPQIQISTRCEETVCEVIK